jgi:hypothetical protein
MNLEGFKCCIINKIPINQFQMLLPHIFNKNIHNYILMMLKDDNEKRIIKVVFDNQCEFFFFDFDVKKVCVCMERLYIWFEWMKTIQKTPKLQAYLFNTPFKKNYNNYNQANINSGFTIDQKIVVYRYEEWFKVLIHEMLHTYYNYSMKQIKEINKKTIQSPIIFTKIINLYSITTKYNYKYNYNPIFFNLNVTEGFIEMLAYYWSCILLNRSLIKQEKILRDRMKQYITNQNEVVVKPYFEDTNVFSYIVINSLLFSFFLKKFNKRDITNIMMMSKDDQLNIIFLILATQI